MPLEILNMEGCGYDEEEDESRITGKS